MSSIGPGGHGTSGAVRQFRISTTVGDAGDRADQAYAVPCEPGFTVLDALEYVRRHFDPDLVYRRSCHHGSCGTCTCRVNGEPVSACTTRVADLADGEIRIDPLNHDDDAGIADVAASRRAFFDQMPTGPDYLRPSDVRPPDGHGPAAAADTDGTPVRFENCIECGACVAACPVEADFRGPAALAAVSRHILKVPEEYHRYSFMICAEDGVGACNEAFECSRVCPASVYPSRHIVDMKRRARC